MVNSANILHSYSISNMLSKRKRGPHGLKQYNNLFKANKKTLETPTIDHAIQHYVNVCMCTTHHPVLDPFMVV